MPLPRTLPLAIALVAASAVVVGAAVVSLRAWSRTLTYPGSPVAFPSPDELGRSFPGASFVSYASTGGPAMTGALVRSPDAAAPARRVVVWFHGNGESAAGNLPLASLLQEAGFDVFLAEYRGYGGQRGSPTESGLTADGQAALEALSRLGYTPDRVILAGRSLGTGIATEVALRRPPALLLLISPFTSAVDMGRTIAGPLAPFLVADRYDTLSRIGTVRAPVAVLHGTLDEVVPVAMGRAVAAAHPGARYVEVPNASHNEFPGLPELILRELREVAR